MGTKTSGREAESTSISSEQTDQAIHGAGAQAIRGLLARGRPDPRTVAAVIAQYPWDTSEMFSLLHSTLGNRFVADVIAGAQPVAAPAPVADLESTPAPDVASAWQGTTDLAGPAPAQASAKDLADADAVLKLSPVGTRGPDGTAAFLIAAIDRGFVRAYPQTKTQLQQFVDDTSTSIHSNEKAPGEKPKEKRKPGEKTNEAAGKERAAQKGIHIEGTGGSYDVELDQAPILQTLAELARTRIQRWRTAGVGKKRAVLSMGQFVRADPGYGGSVHSVGKAIDTAFLGYASTETEAIALLEDLPPGPRKMVFPDGEGVHINNDGNGYDFGFSFDFFNAPSLDAAQQQKVKDEGADHSKTLHAEGLVWGRTVLGESTGTWSDKEGTWLWSKGRDTKTSAEPFLKSDRLKTTLRNLGATPKKP